VWTDESSKQEWTQLMEREVTLLGELRDMLLRQRESVVKNRVAEVNEGADDMQRLLLGLDGLRHRRTELNQHRASDAETAGLEPLARRVRTAALEVARAAAVNREVLGRVMASGEAFLQSLFSSLGTAPTYAPGERGEERPAPGALFDRRG
jgi:hypothetical protein